jgi:hypothetical protein
MADAAWGSESTEIRALEHKEVEIFVQETQPDPAVKYSSRHFF